MLTKLQINNFKSHLETSLELSNLNILTGPNGVGKSSIVQALLLLRQSDEKGILNKGLGLNGDYCNIGKVKDALCQAAENDTISFSLYQQNDQQDKVYPWIFDARQLQGTFMRNLKNPIGDFSPIGFIRANIFDVTFQYLSADRVSAQESYPKDTYSVESEGRLSLEKGQGELVAHFLDFYGFPTERNNQTKVVLDNVLHPTEEHPYLMPQTIAWMREISSDINVHIIEDDKNFEIRYSFNRQGDIATNQFRPENVGFGVSYTLSVVVAILSAKKGALIIIENPEAHIHPKGQAKLAQLIALAAQSGVQLIIETHSDHIINGILVASKQYEQTEKGIDRKFIKLYYMDRESEKQTTICTPIPILEGGRIKSPPKGFFDQIELDLETLMGF